MADSNFSVNTDGMGPAVDGLKSLGDRLTQITQRLESTLDGLGKPWGDDKNGESFFKQYGTSRDQTLSGASSMADATHGVAEGIRTMMKGYTNIDDHAKETARNLSRDGDGGGDGGNYGGGGDGSYSGGDNPPMMAAERRRLLPETPGIPARRMDALIPAERGIPATNADGTPLQPTARLLPREGEALLPAQEDMPAEPMLRATRREGTLLQPATLREGTEIPAEPLQRATLREGTAIPDDAPATPMGRVSEPLLPRMEGVEPLRPVFRSEPAIPAEPLLPVDRGIPAEPLLPAERLEPLQPAEGRSYEATPEIPAERLEPLQPAEGRVTYPTHEGIPVEQPRLFDRVHEGTPVELARLEPAQQGTPAIPAEPVREFERVHETTPLQPLHESVRMMPEEPRGFAELEPARFMPAEPEIPAVPPVSEQ